MQTKRTGRKHGKKNTKRERLVMKKDVVYSHIFKTKDYDKFSFLKENRRINARNYSQLVNSMKEEQLVIPVTVNGNMQIIDGQHRFTACKELGLPVYYYMEEDYGIEQVQRANMVGTNWNKKDFLNMFIAQQKEVYIEFMGLIERYGISINNLIKLFAKVQKETQSRLGKDFESGRFTLKGSDVAVDFLIALEDFDFFDDYKSVSFVTAFIDLYFHPDYNHETMRNRLVRRSSAFEKQGNAGDYLSMLTRDVYSFGPVKKPLFYDAETGRFYS